MLPKNAAEISNGGLYRQAVRCGKIGCRCAAGELHEGYFYFICRVNGRLRKTYVTKERMAEFRSMIQTAKLGRQAQRETRRRNRELLANLGGQLRGYESMMNKRTENS